MKIFDEGNGNGDSVILLSKKEGQALIKALNFATTSTKNLKVKKALSKSSTAYKMAKKIEDELACF